MAQGHCSGCDLDDATLYGHFAQQILAEFRADPSWGRWVTEISHMMPPPDAF